MSGHLLLMFSLLLLILESELKVFCSKNILSILGFSCIIAVIALLALGLTQNKALPENVKVTQTPEYVCVCSLFFCLSVLLWKDLPSVAFPHRHCGWFFRGSQRY